MISKIDLRMSGGKLTEDDGDYDGLDVLCARFVGISRKIGDIQAQGGVVAQDSVEICKKDSGQKKRVMIWVRKNTYFQKRPKRGPNRSKWWAG